MELVLTNTENIIYPNSFFIPHVHSNISLQELVNMIETVEMGNTGMATLPDSETPQRIGVVQKIESIPKQNLKDGHFYYSCFVYIQWNDNYFAKDVQHYLQNDQSYRLYYHLKSYSRPQYIVLLPNKSLVTQIGNPRHVDLILHLPTDIRLETVYSVMEGLDLGKVADIQAFVETDNNTFYENIGTTSAGELIDPVLPINKNPQQLWKHVNMSLWEQKVNIQYNSIYVVFDYWYKTQTAYQFQNEMSNNGFVKIPVVDGMIWTFYEIPPSTNGYNPFVWEKECFYEE